MVAAGAERRTALAAGSLAAAMVLAAGWALVLTSLAWRAPAGRAGLRARLRLLPVAIAERRALAGLDVAAGRPRAARARLAAALRRVPFSASLWLARGEAALQAGSRDGARHAAAAALRRAPLDADVCYRAALLLLQADAAGDATRALRCAVSHAPSRAGQVYDLAHSVYGDDGLVVRTVVPDDADGARRFLVWAYGRDDPDAAAAGWDVLAGRSPSTADVVRHVDFLLARGDVAAADAGWSAVFGPRGPGIVFDGGFESDPVGGGFGWQLGRLDGARIRIASGEAAVEGRRGLAIEFSGGNLDFSQVGQVVPVAGGRRYALTAMARSAGLTSLSGPRFQVEPHRSCPELRTVATRELHGTSPWTRLALEFTTPPGCGAVTVRVRRPPTTRLDRDLRGRLWIDDVRLADLGEGY